MERRMVAESSLSLEESLPSMTRISLKTCKNFLRHSSDLVFKLLMGYSKRRNTCLKKRGKSNEI